MFKLRQQGVNTQDPAANSRTSCEQAQIIKATDALDKKLTDMVSAI